MSIPHLARSIAFAAAALFATHAALAQGASPQPVSEIPLFAVEITTGPKWDHGKPAHEQAFFREHSANLKRMRDAGVLVMGARYSDKGFVVLAAPDERQARAMLDEDPSMKAEVFKYQIHPFSVFYGGTINPRARRAPQ